VIGQNRMIYETDISKNKIVLCTEILVHINTLQAKICVVLLGRFKCIQNYMEDKMSALAEISIKEFTRVSDGTDEKLVAEASDLRIPTGAYPTTIKVYNDIDLVAEYWLENELRNNGDTVLWLYFLTYAGETVAMNFPPYLEIYNA